MTEAYAPTGKSARFSPTWEWQQVLLQWHADGLHVLILFGSAGIVTYRTDKPIVRHQKNLEGV